MKVDSNLLGYVVQGLLRVHFRDECVCRGAEELRGTAESVFLSLHTAFGNRSMHFKKKLFGNFLTIRVYT